MQTAFMVMPFSDNTVKNVYEYVVRPIFERYNIRIRKADEIWSVNPIYDDIISEIHNASIIVVDISGKNPNVFYELGVAHAIKREKTIILTHDEISSTPFDIAHFRIFRYSDSIEASKKLENAIENTIKILTSEGIEEHIAEFEAVYQILNTDRPFSLEAIELLILLKNDGSIVKGTGFSFDLEDGVVHGTSVSVDSKLDKFVRIGYVETDGEAYYMTDKGRLFAKYLIEIQKFPKFAFTLFHDENDS